MTANLKALVVVLALALAVFALARPVCLRMMPAEDFSRRRNAWLVLTVVAFVSPSFWLFVLAAAIVYSWSGSRDANPLGFYLLLLHVIPPAGLEIPNIGSIRVFEFTNYRLLSLVLLAPLAWKIRNAAGDEHRKFNWIDFFVLAFAVMQLTRYMPYESLTNTARRALRTPAAIVDVMASFWLACALFAPIAVFEAVRTWPLYGGVGDLWGIVDSAYVFRGSSLRGLAASGHPLALGYMMSMAFGFWLYLRKQSSSRTVRFAGAALMWLGLLAAYSRAPWIVAVFVLFAYLFLQPRGSTKLMKALLISGVLAGLVLASPMGDKVIDNLPFIGTVNLNTVVYRQRLADLSWKLVEQNPWLGDPFVMGKMEEMRQGEGIIDLVNVYAMMALFYGLIGLSLFAGIFVTAAWNYFSTLRKATLQDPEFSLLGACLLACLLGTLVMQATGSFATSLALLSWILAALGTAYASIGRATEQQSATSGRSAPLAYRA